MDARVGAAGTIELEILAPGHRPDRAIDLPLNGPRVFLDLPAAETCAGVLDGQLEAGHAGILRDRRRRTILGRAPGISGAFRNRLRPTSRPGKSRTAAVSVRFRARLVGCGG